MSRRRCRRRTPRSLIVADGFVTLESSGRRAANVLVYGVDERFWTLPRHRAARRRLRLACPGRRGWRDRRGRPADAPAEAVRDSDRVAVRPERGCREDRAADPGRRPAAGPARRVRAQAAADRGARGVRAAAPHPARPRRRRPGQHRPDRGGRAERVEAASPPCPCRISACRVATVADPPAVAVESASGIVSEALESAITSRREGSRPAADARLHLSRQYDPQGRSPGAVLAGDGYRPRSGWRRRRRRAADGASPDAPAPDRAQRVAGAGPRRRSRRQHRRRLLPVGCRRRG